MHFNFRCLTSFRGCDDTRSLLPEAYADFAAQPDAPTGCQFPYDIIARDQESVLLLHPLSVERKEYNNGSAVEPYDVVTARVVELLKGRSPTDTGRTFKFPVDGPEIPVMQQRQEARTDVLFAGWVPSASDAQVLGPIEGDACGFVEASPANVAAARRGVSEDLDPVH